METKTPKPALKAISFRFKPRSVELLHALAAANGLSKTALLEMLLHQAARQQGVNPPADSPADGGPR